MHSHGFFRLSWSIQLLVGVGLFCVSFLIENAVLQAFFSAPMVALALAASLELGKAAAIIWHRYLTYHGSEGYPRLTRALSAGFRIGLVVLSLLCSMLYLGVQLDRPNLAALRDAELSAIDAELRAAIDELDIAYRTRGESHAERQSTEYAEARTAHDQQINELEALLRAEMDNSVGGHFKGPRYQEYERRLKEARLERNRELSALSRRHFDESAAFGTRLLKELAAARTAQVARADARRQPIFNGSLDGDERVNDPRIVTLIRMSADVFQHRITAPQFVFAFALFISLLMEIGIMLAFDTVTLAVIPALAAEHREAVENEALKAELNGTTGRDELRHREAMDRIRRAAERTIDEARGQMDQRRAA